MTRRIRRGFENYWARRKAGLKAGTPHFVGRGDYKSITYPQSGFSLRDKIEKVTKKGKAEITYKTLKLSKVGNIRIIQHRPIEGKFTIRSPRKPTALAVGHDPSLTPMDAREHDTLQIVSLRTHIIWKSWKSFSPWMKNNYS